MKPLKRNRISLSIRFKIILVILVMVVFSLISYLINKEIIRKSANLYERSQQNERKILTKAIFSAKAELIEKTNIHYACSDWMVQFVHRPDTIEAKQYISDPNLIGIDFFGVYNLRGLVVYDQKSSNKHDLEISLPRDFFRTLYHKRFLDFYIQTTKGITHIVASTIHQSLDTSRKKTPAGFLILAIVYDKSYFNKIEKLINCNLTFLPSPSKIKSDTNSEIPFLTYDNSEVGKIVISNDSEFVLKVKEMNNNLEWTFIFYVVVLCFITILTYNLFVLKPLKIIQAALNYQSDKIARNLMYKRDEFGKISRLIIRFFQQRKLLDEKLKKLSETTKKLKTLNDELSETANNLLAANNEISIQQKNTTDNIYYASVVQRAALIPSFDIDKSFKEYFIIFKPRDVISGDFYWFYQHLGKFYIATADCTGHGLSGSLMSMLGISFLNQIIHQSGENITAAEILKKLRSFIVNSLHQQGEFVEVHDGIDIGLCIFDLQSMTVEYAAAYNPLYLLRYNNTTSSYDLNIYKGDTMPVGIFERLDNFSNYSISLQQNDILYLFTDGFVDQFGGPRNKKFLSKNLKELLLSIAHYPLAKQKEIIIDTFDRWKGDSYQVDDVTMIGLKICN